MTLDVRGLQVHDDDQDDIEFRLLRELEERFPAIKGAGKDRYILNAAGEPEECPNLFTWGRWMETAERHVCHDMDEGVGGEKVRVSTVFLGLNHNFSRKGPPVLWETMVFGGPLDGTMRRYTSRDAAIMGHQELCRQVSRAQQGKPPE